MPEFLTQEWLDLHGSLGADLPERPGVNALLQIVVTKTSAGEVGYVQTLQDGRIVRSELGRDEEAEVTLTQSAGDAALIARGELDLNVAFMQGRVKVVGSMGALMAAMPVTQSPEYQQLIASVAAQTDF